MHELALSQEIVAIVERRCPEVRVRRVVLEVGMLAAVMPDALRFCFDLCCQGTSLEGAILEVVEIPGRAKCRECAAEIELSRPWGRCGCGSTALDLVGGVDLSIRNVEVV